MKLNGLIVADGARCRVFSLVPAETDDLEAIVTLEEIDDLVNPDARASGQALFSEVKTGRNQAPGGGPGHGYDDHRSAHRDEVLRRFARLIEKRVRQFVRENDVSGLVVVAERRFLAFLREQFSSLRGCVVTEIAEDATKKNVAELHRLLEEHEVLKAGPPPKATYHPRGQTQRPS